jgi:hypothetical protein
VNNGRWQVSPDGGVQPLWARNGRELFYRDGAGLLAGVPIQTAPSFIVGRPRTLIQTRYVAGVNARTYDVSPDGRRFLMIKETANDDAGENAAPARMVVVLNWHEELKTRLPPN